MAAVSADQQYCTGMLISVHYIALYICWQVCRGAMKIMLWLWKFCDNFGLRKQHLGCHDGCGLMAVDIDCRILGTALCWNDRSDWLLHRFDVRLYGTRERALQLQSGGKEQSESDRKVQSDSDHKEHWTLQSDSDHKEHWALNSYSDQHFTRHAMLPVRALKFSVLSAAELFEFSPQCASKTPVCCRFRRGV